MKIPSNNDGSSTLSRMGDVSEWVEGGPWHMAPVTNYSPEFNQEECHQTHPLPDIGTGSTEAIDLSRGSFVVWGYVTKSGLGSIGS